MAAINSFYFCRLTLLLITFSACNSSPMVKSDVIDTAKSNRTDTAQIGIEKDVLPNDNFRRQLRPHLGEKDKVTFDSVLTTLDNSGLTFCQYIQRLMELDDSCFAVANRKFPDPSQHRELSIYITKAVDKAEIAYSKSLGLSKHCLEFAGTVYAFDTTARRICGNFPSYESKY